MNTENPGSNAASVAKWSDNGAGNFLFSPGVGGSRPAPVTAVRLDVASSSATPQTPTSSRFGFGQTTFPGASPFGSNLFASAVSSTLTPKSGPQPATLQPPLVSLTSTVPFHSFADLSEREGDGRAGMAAPSISSLSLGSNALSARPSSSFADGALVPYQNRRLRDVFSGMNVSEEDGESQTQQFRQWVTVFGFPPDMASIIINNLSEYGTIEDQRIPPAPTNFIHLKFASEFQAKRAMASNGKVLNGRMIIGVMECIDKSVLIRRPEKPDSISTGSIFDSKGATPTDRSRKRPRQETDWWGRFVQLFTG